MFSLLLTYLLLLLLVFIFQRKLIYLPERYSLNARNEMSTKLGLKVWPHNDDFRGFVSKKTLDHYKGTVLVFHGNAGSAVRRFYYFDALERLGFRVIVAEYPGYGARHGEPSEKKLIADGLQTAQQAFEQFGEPLYLWGESLGGGVVSGIIKTGRVQVKGIILLMPFDNLPNLAHSHYWLFLGKWLTREKYNNVENLQDYKGKIAVILAEKDEIIPKKLSLNLINSLPGQKKLWSFENTSHNNFPIQPNALWWSEVMNFTTDHSLE